MLFHWNAAITHAAYRGRPGTTLFNSPGKPIFLREFTLTKNGTCYIEPRDNCRERSRRGRKRNENKADVNGDPVHTADRSGGFVCQNLSSMKAKPAFSLQNATLNVPALVCMYGERRGAERKEGRGRDCKRKVDTSWSLSFLSIWISAAALKALSELWANKSNPKNQQKKNNN